MGRLGRVVDEYRLLFCAIFSYYTFIFTLRPTTWPEAIRGGDKLGVFMLDHLARQDVDKY